MPTSPLRSGAAALGSLVVPFSCDAMIAGPRSPRGKQDASGELDLSAWDRCLSREPARRAGEVGISISATERARVIEPGRSYVGKQGFTYGAGASAKTVGAQRICVNILAMPDGARARRITIAASRR
jgi:hypothetical protein